MTNEINKRTEMLIGRSSVERLSRSHVAVVGLGGVGGHAAEALARAGVGQLTLIDGDAVAASNMNRQLFAAASTIGLAKTEAAVRRLADAAPSCRLMPMQIFLTPENIPSLDLQSFDYVVDAIDSTSSKLALIKACSDSGVPIISAMGAGNKLDPTRFEVSDIYKTDTCPLAAVIRRECRRAGIKRLKVVYSREPAISPVSSPDTEGGGRTPPASISFVPSVCGLIIAGEVIKDLAADEIARALDRTN